MGYCVCIDLHVSIIMTRYQTPTINMSGKTVSFGSGVMVASSIEMDIFTIGQCVYRMHCFLRRACNMI